MKIIRAIAAGERNSDVLTSHRDVRCRAPVETNKAALNGNDSPEHLIALSQSMELYDFYQSKVRACDRRL